MKEYEVYVPLRQNDGKRIAREKIDQLKKRLVKRFGGLTHFPQKNEGVWKIGRATFRDEIVLLRVLADEKPAVTNFFKKLKQELQRDLKQQEILIIKRHVAVV